MLDREVTTGGFANTVFVDRVINDCRINKYFIPFQNRQNLLGTLEIISRVGFPGGVNDVDAFFADLSPP